MAGRLSAIHACRPLLPGRFVALISVRGIAFTITCNVVTGMIAVTTRRCSIVKYECRPLTLRIETTANTIEPRHFRRVTGRKYDNVSQYLFMHYRVFS
jgi:hypothetical protein